MRGKPPKPLLESFKPDNLPEFTDIEELPQPNDLSEVQDNLSAVSSKSRPRGKIGRNFFTEMVKLVDISAGIR